MLVDCGTRAVIGAGFGDIAATKAHVLCRSGARRTPLILRRLSDGSYLSVLGYGRLKVRIVPDARPDRVSLTAALETAGEQVIAAVGIIIPVGDGPVGAIGRAVLADLLPSPRNRGKARTRHNPTSKYGPNVGTFPQTSLKYPITTTVMIMEEDLTARSKR